MAETWWGSVLLSLCLGIPQLWTTWLFCFSFVRARPANWIRKLGLLAVVATAYTDATAALLPQMLQFLNSIAVNGLLIFLLFRDLPWKNKLYVLLGGFTIGMVQDIVVSGILVLGLGLTDKAALFEHHLPAVILLYYPIFGLLLVASWFIRKSRSTLIDSFVSFGRLKLAGLISLLAVQFFIISTLHFLYLTYLDSTRTFRFDASIPILTYGLVIVSFATLASIARLLIRSREQAIRSTQNLYIEDINRMFVAIRGQRHDFLNHLQVVYSMLQLGKIDALRKYVGELVQETEAGQSVVNHDSPTIAAFIRAKWTQAAADGIDFTYELPVKWEPGSTVRAIDLVKMLGNLVDNAFDEARCMEDGARKVHLRISAADDGMEILVRNGGRALSPEDIRLMLMPGYTTKSGNHSGIGLAIVKERVDYYKGSLEIRSNAAEGTVVSITLPRFELQPA